MEPETVYNPTTITNHAGQKGYLDNISYASITPNRCRNIAVVVIGVLSSMVGLALILYGSLFHASFSSEPGYESTAEKEKRLQELHMYQIFVWIGVPLLCLGAALWTYYLYKTGRCKYCPLCPGARKRRRLRKNFQTQCLESGNLSSNYTATTLSAQPTEDQQLMQQAVEENAGLEDTDAMLSNGSKPVLRPMQTSI